MGLVVAKHYSTLHDAQIAREMLRSQAIGAAVLDEQNTALMGVGANGLAPSFRVWVPEDELAVAQHLLADAELAQPVAVMADEDYDDSYDWTEIDEEPRDDRMRSEYGVEASPLARVIAGGIFALLAAGILAAAFLVKGGNP